MSHSLKIILDSFSTSHSFYRLTTRLNKIIIFYSPNKYWMVNSYLIFSSLLSLVSQKEKITYIAKKIGAELAGNNTNA